MKVRFLVNRSDGIEAGDEADLDPAEAERVLASGAAELVAPSKRGKRRLPETPDSPPTGETR